MVAIERGIERRVLFSRGDPGVSLQERVHHPLRYLTMIFLLGPADYVGWWKEDFDDTLPSMTLGRRLQLVPRVCLLHLDHLGEYQL